MNELRKSALWALVSIPISLLGIMASMSLAHGGATLLMVLVAPGIAVMFVPNWDGVSEKIIYTFAFLGMYASYFIVIYSIRVLIKKIKTNKKKLSGTQ